MAIDTAEKRRSASQVITGLFGAGVTPNVSTDGEWRQQAGWGYSGILTGEPTSGFFDVIIETQQVTDCTVASYELTDCTLTVQRLTDATITFSG